MVGICYADGRRENTQENATHKKGENDQEDGPEPDGYAKYKKGLRNYRGKLR